jgi:2-keto-4-pentenoate hydratase/2-oxohepta-3-ene-1,7-dioic acid hydratase in catechol pathway
LLAPIPRPGTVVCLSGNYRAHLEEWTTPYDKSALPLLFMKPSTTVVGYEAQIQLPRLAKTVRWEIELVIVIGKSVRDVPVDAVDDCIVGYSIGNDVSARSLVLPPGRVPDGADRFHDWLTGKWFDTFAPLGPYLVTKDEVPDPHSLPLELRLNGQVRQQASTADMIFSVAEIVSFASQFMTLEPGDVIYTGTPAEIGPQDRMLEDGDVLEAEIEGLGLLRNTAGRPD